MKNRTKQVGNGSIEHPYSRRLVIVFHYTLAHITVMCRSVLIWYAAHQGLRRPLLNSTLWMFTGTLAVSSDYFALFASS